MNGAIFEVHRNYKHTGLWYAGFYVSPYRSGEGLFRTQREARAFIAAARAFIGP